MLVLVQAALYSGASHVTVSAPAHKKIRLRSIVVNSTSPMTLQFAKGSALTGYINTSKCFWLQASTVSYQDDHVLP